MANKVVVTWNSKWDSVFLQLLLYGDENLSYEVNRSSVLTLTITYILKTERFD